MGIYFIACHPQIIDCLLLTSNSKTLKPIKDHTNANKKFIIAYIGITESILADISAMRLFVYATWFACYTPHNKLLEIILTTTHLCHSTLNFVMKSVCSILQAMMWCLVCRVDW